MSFCLIQTDLIRPDCYSYLSAYQCLKWCPASLSRMVSYQAVSKIVASWTTAGSLLATGRLTANSSGHRQCTAGVLLPLVLILISIHGHPDHRPHRHVRCGGHHWWERQASSSRLSSLKSNTAFLKIPDQRLDYHHDHLALSSSSIPVIIPSIRSKLQPSLLIFHSFDADLKPRFQESRHHLPPQLRLIFLPDFLPICVMLETL